MTVTFAKIRQPTSLPPRAEGAATPRRGGGSEGGGCFAENGTLHNPIALCITRVALCITPIALCITPIPGPTPVRGGRGKQAV